MDIYIYIYIYSRNYFPSFGKEVRKQSSRITFQECLNGKKRRRRKKEEEEEKRRKERRMGSLTVKMIVNLRLEHVEARAGLIRLLIANTAARELIKVLARIHPLPHERHHPLRGFLAGFRVAQTLLAVPLSDTGLVLQSKSSHIFLLLLFSDFFTLFFFSLLASNLIQED